ncbi:LacI family DNA-binding transcriptional regulator (plasmid) [Rhizobium sp. CB3090]|uniref:LacI family DNA-binding transcriptional regulator n=1 Tax=Rhizobium sp. CB3090 TaxID=3039156 RepID=UPI0024B25410|nr:LacI family DNA-binding transcriptional regulator [Rhizobium sp. CB3090]WFU12881.1 LacI family DNA-binding transcriptional regulator [Rhizobium sp. CB3090]
MATIRDVAKLAGVGLGTASRVLSGSGSVSESAKLAVQDAVRKLNFRPSSTARALSKRQSGIIGVLAPLFHGYYYATAISLTERQIRSAGKHMVLMSSRGEKDSRWDDARGLASLMERNCDGILILGTALSERELLAAAIQGPAIAILNRRINALDEACFSIDHFAAGRAVGQHMLAQGHRQFATITGPMDIEDARLRHEGFVGALSERGVALDPALIVEGNYEMEGGELGAAVLLSAGRPFTGLFCGNDETAISAKNSLKRAGINPYIVGYDNMSLLDYAGIEISSVEVPIADLVSNACAYLLNRCYGVEGAVSRAFSARLIVRG